MQDQDPMVSHVHVSMTESVKRVLRTVSDAHVGDNEFQCAKVCVCVKIIIEV